MNNITINVLLRSLITMGAFNILCTSKKIFFTLVLWRRALQTQFISIQNKTVWNIQDFRYNKSSVDPDIFSKKRHSYLVKFFTKESVSRKQKVALRNQFLNKVNPSLLTEEKVTFCHNRQNKEIFKELNNQILINHKINLVGYIYNKGKKKLYCIISFPVTTV